MYIINKTRVQPEKRLKALKNSARIDLAGPKNVYKKIAQYKKKGNNLKKSV